MSTLRIMQCGTTLASWPCNPEVSLFELAKTLDEAIKQLVTQGPVAIWVENGNVLHFIGSWE
jgi:hypothetical protein